MWGEIFIAGFTFDHNNQGDWSLFMVGQTCKALYSHARTFYRQQLRVSSLSKAEEQSFFMISAASGVLQWPLATLEEWIFGPAYFLLFAPVEEPRERQLRVVFLGKALRYRDDFDQLLESPDRLQSILKRLQKEFKTKARCICCDDEHQPKFRMRAFVKPMLKYAVRHDNVEALRMLWPFAHFYSNHQTLVQGNKYNEMRGRPRELILGWLHCCKSTALMTEFIRHAAFKYGIYEKLVVKALGHSSIGALGFLCEKRPHDGWAVGLYFLLRLWHNGSAADSDTRPVLSLLISQWPTTSDIIGDKLLFLSQLSVAAVRCLELNNLPEQLFLIDATLAECDSVHLNRPDFSPDLRENLVEVRDSLNRIHEERKTMTNLAAIFNAIV